MQAKGLSILEGWDALSDELNFECEDRACFEPQQSER